MSTPLAQSIASAIQQQEGYGTPGAVTITANNNPGALIAWPGYPTVNGFAQFPDYATGFAAAQQNVQNYINQGLTLTQLANKWAPSGAPNDPNGINQPSAYASFLASQTGLDPNTPLNSIGTTSGGYVDPTLQDPGIVPDGTTPTVSEASAIDFSNPLVWGGLILGGVVLWFLFRD